MLKLVSSLHLDLTPQHKELLRERHEDPAGLKGPSGVSAAGEIKKSAGLFLKQFQLISQSWRGPAAANQITGYLREMKADFGSLIRSGLVFTDQRRKHQ